jgi:hypothetical protein
VGTGGLDSEFVEKASLRGTSQARARSAYCTVCAVVETSSSLIFTADLLVEVPRAD